MSMKIPEGYITLKEYSVINSLSVIQLRKKCRERKIDCVKINGNYYINSNFQKKINERNSKKDLFKTLYSGVFLEKVKNKYKESVDIVNFIYEGIKNQIEFNTNLNNQYKTDFTTDFNNLLNFNESYQSYIIKAKGIESNYKKILSEYKEIEDFIKINNIKKIKLSVTSSSVYLTVENDNFIKLINSLSCLNFKITNDISNKKTVVIRFSDHLPNFCKKKKEIDSNKKQNYDILVFYKDCNEKVIVK